MQEQGQLKKSKQNEGQRNTVCLYMAKNSRLVLGEVGKGKKGEALLTRRGIPRTRHIYHNTYTPD